MLISLAGALAVPLAWMAAAGMAQPEVDVIVRSAAMLMHHGTPYASPAALAAAHTWHAYDPYLPALIAFGVPRVLGGGAPASRVGYFVYPLGVAAWLLLAHWPALPRDESVDPEPQCRRLAVQVHD